MTDQEYILEDDFLDDLDAACQPPSVVTPNSRVRAPSASILAQLSPAKPGAIPLSSPERLQSPTKLRKSPLSIPSPQRSPLALSISKPLISRPIDLDLSDDSSTEQDEVILVGVMPTVRPLPQPRGPLLQISSLAPLKKPTRLQLTNRQKRIDLKRESLLEKLLVPNTSAPSSVVRSLGTKPKPTLQPTLDAYFNVKPLKRPQTPKTKKPFEPVVEVINLATSSNLFWCRPIEPFGAISHPLNLERPLQSVQCDHLSRIPWKTLCSQSSYVAALINPPWEQGCSVESFKESLQPLTTMLLPTGGFLFWWIENEFLGDVFHLCKQWHFHHVENMCWVRLNVDNTISRRRPTHGAVCNQSKMSLFIFRKTGNPIKLRHQRNVDVHFEMDRHWLQHHSKPYEYVYQLIETLLPAESESEATGPRFLEIWARPHHTRPGWTSITLPDKPELVHVEHSQESLPGFYTTATVMSFPEPSLSQLEASQGSNISVLLEQHLEDTIALNEEELEALLSQRGSTKLDPEQTILLDNWDRDEDG